MLGPGDEVSWSPRRVLIAGVTGSGKSTLARVLAQRLQLPYVEIDSLYHGPKWTPREQFVSDVDRFTRGKRWLIEWQYPSARELLIDRADTLIWLDHPAPVSLARVLRRTIARSRHRTELWNGNVEGPLRTVFSDPDNILRWAWSTRHVYRTTIPALEPQHPGVWFIRLRGQRQVDSWLSGLGSVPS
ncbi:MAG TPA: AAA family ATPase [Galbitalea sp.]|jgi:adenylate kinase family enzyme|nr:AAA family ATPase [Galbitalea sp.]